MLMRRSAVLALIVAGTLTACLQPPATELSEKDVSDIKATVDRWVNDFLQDKKDDFANILTADMVLAPPNVKPFIGRDAALGYMKAFPTITKFDVTKDEVTGHGDLAYVRGTYSTDFILPDKSKGHDEGNYMEVHRKQADGSWPYSRLIFNSALPLPAPAPAPAKKK